MVVANKVDLFADKSRMLPLLTRLNEMWPRAEIFPVSALNKDGLPELAKLIKKQLPKGIAQFPEDQISTAPVRFMAAEIVREKLFLHLRQEVPYGIAVEVENWDEDPEREQTIIHAVIYVARPMHKGMVIGRAWRPVRTSASSSAARCTWNCGSRSARTGRKIRPSCASWAWGPNPCRGMHDG